MKYLKLYETFREYDPYKEENWDELDINNLKLYLSIEQPPIYKNGEPFQQPWKKKYYVLFEKNSKYYIIGEYRFGNGNFKMFYFYNKEIEFKMLNKYNDDIYRELNNVEKKEVLNTLENNKMFTVNLFDPNNGKTYIELLSELINENQDNLSNSYHDPSVGDLVYINYKIPGGNKDYVPTPVKIISIKGSGRQRAYIASHKVETSEFKNAPNQLIKKSDIIGTYKGIDTPVGSGWISSKPTINTGVNQISNDMYL